MGPSASGRRAYARSSETESLTSPPSLLLLPPAPPRKKATKVALTDFLGGGSWADEVEELPTAPIARPEGFSSSGGGDFMSRPDRGDRSDYLGPPREELPMPTAPPYTAFLGNLAFDVGESEVEGFFDGMKVRRSCGGPRGILRLEGIPDQAPLPLIACS